MPGSSTLFEAALRSVQGMHDLVTDVAVASLPERGVRKAYAGQGVFLEGLAGVRALDLSVIDHVTPTLGTRYAFALAGEGALAGVLAGGGTAAAAAGGLVGAGVGAAPGAAVTTGVIAADVAAVLAGSTRVVAHYSAYHGYDARDPLERAFLLGVMGSAVAGDQATKLQALAELRRLSAALAVRGVAGQASNDLLVRLLRRLFASVGESLTQRKVASLVPVAGALLGGGLNYTYVREVADCAKWLYRERFLVDKYSLHEDVGDAVGATVVLGAIAGDLPRVAQVPTPPKGLTSRMRSLPPHAGPAD